MKSEWLKRATEALSLYTDDEDRHRLTDLLTDLRHLAAEGGLDFDLAIESSERHYHAESDPVGQG